MALSDMAARKAKSATKPYKLADSGGLFLLVNPNGSKLWKLKFRFHQKERQLAFGPFPLVSLAEARERRDTAKKLLLAGTDPSAERKRERAAAATAARATFGLIAEEQLEIYADKGLADATMAKHRWALVDLAGSLANRPIADAPTSQVLLPMACSSRGLRLPTGRAVLPVVRDGRRYADGPGGVRR